MIETKVLTSAVGIQRGDVIDKTESTVLPSATNAVIIGRFKRGRTDRPFLVTYDNYAGLLGRDINNSNYLAVEDAFNTGISQLWIRRIGVSQ
ncbi:hypothetical protein [Psychrobacter sp.]|uniref:hypothetical protein n=1 Tax=Psychrobacter sp. TaxID=56811 RepID=UPI0025F69803|nr:hypothetical protein [Psychrobacter sp.]